MSHRPEPYQPALAPSSPVLEDVLRSKLSRTDKPIANLPCGPCLSWVEWLGCLQRGNPLLLFLRTLLPAHSFKCDQIRAGVTTARHSNRNVYRTFSTRFTALCRPRQRSSLLLLPAGSQRCCHSPRLLCLKKRLRHHRRTAPRQPYRCSLFVDPCFLVYSTPASAFAFSLLQQLAKKMWRYVRAFRGNASHEACTRRSAVLLVTFDS